MAGTTENYSLLIELLKNIYSELQLQSDMLNKKVISSDKDFIFLSFKGPEIYLLLKAFVDSGGCPNENYKTLLEKTVPFIANKHQKGFSVDSVYKCSDKVCPESKENVKRFLQRMIRNIDSYD